MPAEGHRRRAGKNFDGEELVDSVVGESVRSSKKRKLLGVRSLLDTEAREDDVEGDDYDEEADGEDEFLDEAAEAKELALAHRREVDAGLANTGRKDMGRLATTIGQLEERYQREEAESMEAPLGVREGEYEEEDEEEYGYDEAAFDEMSKLLPMAEGGWRLWKVPTVRNGVERETCIQILTKFAQATDAQREAFCIASAYASDTVKGCVYIEAPSPLHIIDAFRDIRNLVLSKSRIQMVPLKERADVFRTANVNDSGSFRYPKRGEWVRFARGLYAGDIVLVSDVDEGRQSVTVRVVPRIDLNAEAADPTEEKMVFRKRPAPSLISLAEVESRGFETERINHSSVGEAFKFKSYVIEERTGYLMKTVRMGTLVIGDKVRPTSMEIEAFGDRAMLSELFGDVIVAGAEPFVDSVFEPGQRVLVTKGDLMGMSGTVVSVESNDQLKIKPDICEGVPSTIVTPTSFCQKRFAIGETVKVMTGKQEGDTGLIVKIDKERDIAHLLSTETHQQISVPLGHLAPTPNDSFTPAGLNKIDGYAVGDLVQLSTTLDVGVIVKLLKTKRLDVLTKEGTVSCDVSQLAGKKMLRLGRALDTDNEQFGPGASVEIIDGQHAREIGTVRYIWKDAVFVSVPSAVAVGGLIAVDASSVRVAQKTERSPTGGPQTGHQPHGTPDAGTATGGYRHHGGRHAGGGGQLGFRSSYIIMGSPVKLVGGAHKGLNGELRSLQGADAVVLIPALGKEVRYPRSLIQLQDSESRREVARYFRSNSSAHGH